MIRLNEEIPLQAPTGQQQQQKQSQKNLVSAATTSSQQQGGGEEEDEVTASHLGLGLAASSASSVNQSRNTPTATLQHQTAHTSSQDQDSGLILHKVSPLLFLRYLYLYVDPSLTDPSLLDHEINNQDSLLDSAELDIVPRHALACHTSLPLDAIKTISYQSIQNESVKSAFNRFGSSCFFYLKVSLDTNYLPQGDFSSLLLLETPLSSLLSCTTCIYSYTDKILSTKELKNMHRTVQQDGLCSFIYRFDFVHDYWTAFLNGFRFLNEEEGEVGVAVESVTMIQMFHAVSNDDSSSSSQNDLPLLCLAYDFHVGDGSVSMSLVESC